MLSKIKISPHEHSGKLIHHAHTSYAGLGFVMLLAGLILLSVTTAATAVHPPPGLGTIGLAGTVPGQAPTVAAVIKAPINGARFVAVPVLVSGTCPLNTIVEIFANGVFAGSDYCKDDLTFSLQADLLIGQNDLVAKVYDALDQAGPDSNTVTVYYDPPPTIAQLLPGVATASLDTSYIQLLLRTAAVYRGAFPGDNISLNVDVIGGLAPYAFVVDWGDGKTDLISRANGESFGITHAYGHAGVYQVIAKATDAKNKNAYLQTTIIVNGPAATTGSGGTTKTPAISTKSLLLAWPMWVLLVLVIISFWLGERHEKNILKRRGQLVQPQAHLAS